MFEGHRPEAFEDGNDLNDIRPPVTPRNIRAAGRALIEFADAVERATVASVHATGLNFRGRGAVDLSTAPKSRKMLRGPTKSDGSSDGENDVERDNTLDRRSGASASPSEKRNPAARASPPTAERRDTPPG